ncbi:MAG: hypothetical protein JSR80_05405 [Verrucomicrobia bacterium]|nr:hypothetical protein [Verrucomicrobiota bacterium]
MDIQKAWQESSPYDVWRGQTAHSSLNTLSFGLRAGASLLGTLLLFRNSTSKPLTGFILGSGTLLTEGVALLSLNTASNQVNKVVPVSKLKSKAIHTIMDHVDAVVSPNTIASFPTQKLGFTPILRAISLIIALHGLGALMGALGKGASFGNILLTITTFGGLTSWNVYLLKNRTTPGKELPDQLKELCDFPETSTSLIQKTTEKLKNICK